MKINKIFIIGITFLFFGASINTSVAIDADKKSTLPLSNRNTLYVGGSGSGNYTYIQDAINNASLRDRIYVYSGIYFENIFIDKSLILQGENKTTTILDGCGQHDVIHIQPLADNVTITQFTIQNSGNVYGAGFDVGLEIHSHYTIIHENILKHHPNMAMQLFATNNNQITNNYFIDNNQTALNIMASSNNIISHNIFIDNHAQGIFIDAIGESSNNNIHHNQIKNSIRGLITNQQGNNIHHNDFINTSIPAIANYNFYRKTNSKNTWDHNYWENRHIPGFKYIPGLLGFINLNFDFNPSKSPNIQSNIHQYSIKSDGNIIKWAVLIGVGFNPHQYVYSRRDIYELKKILIREGWDEDHIHILLEEKATRAAIINSFTWLIDNGIDEDDFLFFYSGTHGYYFQDQIPLDEPDGKDEFIQPFDYDWETDDFCITDDELADLFNSLPIINMSIIIEACHSGGMLDGTHDLKKSGRVVLTCCDVEESGFPNSIRRRWLYCYYICKGMKGFADKNQDQCISVEETHYFAYPRVKIRSIIANFIRFHKLIVQNPQIYDGWPTEDNNIDDLKIINL
jgi:hypothetical protein